MQKNNPSSGIFDFEARISESLQYVNETMREEEFSCLSRKSRVILLDFCDTQKRYYLEFSKEGKCQISNKILHVSPMLHISLSTKIFENLANQTLNPLCAFLENKISISGLSLLESRVFLPFAWNFLAAYQKLSSSSESLPDIKRYGTSFSHRFLWRCLSFPVSLVLFCIPILRFLKLRKWTLSLENWMEETWYLWDKEMRKNLTFGRKSVLIKKKTTDTKLKTWDSKKIEKQEIQANVKEKSGIQKKIDFSEPEAPEPEIQTKKELPKPETIATEIQKKKELPEPEAIVPEIQKKKELSGAEAIALEMQKKKEPAEPETIAPEILRKKELPEPEIQKKKELPAPEATTPETTAPEIPKKELPEPEIQKKKESPKGEMAGSHEAIIVPQEESSMAFSGEEELDENEAIIFAHEALALDANRVKKEEKAIYIEFSEEIKGLKKESKDPSDEESLVEEESDWDDSQDNITIIDLEQEKQRRTWAKKEENEEKITIVDLEKEKNQKDFKHSWEDSEDDITVVDVDKKWEENSISEKQQLSKKDQDIPTKIPLEEKEKIDDYLVKETLAAKEEVIAHKALSQEMSEKKDAAFDGTPFLEERQASKEEVACKTLSQETLSKKEEASASGPLPEKEEKKIPQKVLPEVELVQDGDIPQEVELVKEEENPPEEKIIPETKQKEEKISHPSIQIQEKIPEPSSSLPKQTWKDFFSQTSCKKSPKIQFLSKEEKEKIIEKALDHLQNFGCSMDYVRACNSLSQYGCIWDATSNMVKFPQSVLLKALENFQERSRPDLSLCLTAGSCRQRILEWEKKLSREGCIEDAKKIIQLFNTLPSIDFSSCGIYPFDVPKDAIDIVNTALLCKYSCKPFLQDIDSLDSGKLILEMLRLLKDSRQENIREMVYILPASLHYKKVGLQLAELWGQEQYPIWIKSSFIEENSSFYATLCQVVCEWLSGIAYLASLETNSKVVLHWDSSLVYKEHLVFCSPGQIQIAFALQEIAECLGFSCFTNLSPNLTWWDFQTGWEKGCISSVNWIRENPFMSYVGILGEDFSPEQLVLDNFIANIFKKWNEKNQETAQGISLEQLCELARQRYVPDEKKWEAKEMSLLLGEMFYKEKEEILRTIHRSVQNIFDAPKYSSLLEEDREKEVERLVQIRYEQLGV